MPVKQLIKKLEQLPGDFEVQIEAGDYNLLEALSVYEGSAWNVIIDCLSEPELIENENKPKKKKKK